jgi:thiazole synthase ThiGH ThiG subunit
MASDKIYVLVKADTHTGTHVDLAMELGLPVSILNTTVNNREQPQEVRSSVFSPGSVNH